MIKREFVHLMARYNRWQNNNLYGAADKLDDAARRADRGAFFGSVHATLSHLLWGDCMWMSRFDGWTKPDVSNSDSGGWVGDWQDLKDRRAEVDARILDWAARVRDEALAADLSWHSGATGRDVTKPLALGVVHFFNHQTHHRGQVHAMLTAAGARPGGHRPFHHA